MLYAIAVKDAQTPEAVSQGHTSSFDFISQVESASVQALNSSLYIFSAI